ncbi:hypothetical protein LPJ64_004413 [Coemansia asiatica]|uniref:Myb-like domain-containing protein n=1 Tax=Coemansia asiatica TaxID=1052880 RepID=A0A9W7XG70_9FUNG|nr:hypothetical protein LPJ64_004413 [Coemansia asiatica]
MDHKEQQQYLTRFLASRGLELMPIQRELISNSYQQLSGNNSTSSANTKQAYPGIQASNNCKSNSNSNYNNGDEDDMSSPAALLPAVWTSLSATCAMDTAGFTANLSPPISQASGFATPWPLATSAEPYPQSLMFSYPSQPMVATTSASSIPLQSLAAAMPQVASSTCSERPQSRTHDPSLVPMFSSPFDPPMSLSPHLLSIESASGAGHVAEMTDDLFMHISKHRALGRSWQEISNELSFSCPGATTIGDAAQLARMFDAKLLSINQSAAASASAAAAAAVAAQSLPLSLPLPLPLSLTMQFPPQQHPQHHQNQHQQHYQNQHQQHYQNQQQQHYQPRPLAEIATKRQPTKAASSAKRSTSASASSSSSSSVSSRALSKRTLSEEKEHQTYINIDQFFELQRLIRIHGEDWNKLGQLMSMRGSDLSACWNGYTVDSKVTREWTSGEMEILGLCRELGIPCRLSSKIIGTKLPLQCRRKILKRDRVDVHTIYEHLYPGKSPPSEPVVWSTGHVDVLHKTRVPASCNQSNMVSKCVEQMVVAKKESDDNSSVLEVDWSNVSRQLGISVKQCLELNRFSSNKASWIYSAEAFEWGRAERMRQFIVSNYPAPTPIDFVAVSNYLWTDMTDCISMYGLLCGRFEWTQEVLAKISQLVDMGWTDENIARYLSPVMTGTRIAHTRLMFQAQAQAQAFASVYGKPQIPVEMDAAGLAAIQNLVDFYAEDRAVDIVQLLDQIRATLPAYNRTLVDKCALITISNHSTCVAKMTRRAHRKPKAKTVSATGNKSAAAAAAFDDPAFYSAKWTDKEIDMLVQYARANGPERNWRHFADIIGTKTPSQCSNKYRSLRRYHKIKI